jgi:hypothetical protein
MGVPAVPGLPAAIGPRGGQKRSVGRASSEPGRAATGAGALALAPEFAVVVPVTVGTLGAAPVDEVGIAGVAGADGIAPSVGAFWARLG